MARYGRLKYGEGFKCAKFIHKNGFTAETPGESMALFKSPTVSFGDLPNDLKLWPNLLTDLGATVHGVLKVHLTPYSLFGMWQKLAAFGMSRGLLHSRQLPSYCPSF